VAVVVGIGVGVGAGRVLRRDSSPPSAASGRSVFRAAVVRPASLDPAQARTVDELLVADQLFDSLTAYDPATLEPVPSLAASWTASADQQHWDFTLRPGAVFSDGTPVTAADVKASFERVARSGSGSSVADLLEGVSGYRAFADGSSSSLAGVVAVGDSVVHLDLDGPLSVLPSVLGSPALGVMPASVASPFPASPALPVGSGPFRLSSSSPSSLVLERSPSATTRSQRLDFRLFDDKAAAYSAFVAGDVDWSEVPADQVASAASRFGRAAFKPYLAELFYAFNLRSPAFADVRLREAIVRAVDRSSIISSVYGGAVRPADGLLVEGLPGHQASPCGSLCSFDVTRSKGLVAELQADGSLPTDLALDFEDDKTQTAVATAIRDDLAAVGLTVALRPKPLADYQKFAVAGSQSIFRLGWVAPFPSADAVLSPLFQTGSPNNLTGFSSAGVDAALSAARSSSDPAARLSSYQEAERLVLAQLPVIPIAQFEVQSVTSPRVRGLVVTSNGTFDGRTVWLAAAK
jgi:oligopeptide transport system substrate-binding protein